MDKQILEEVKRYLQLSNYNTKLTLSENTQVIEEQRVGATTIKELEGLMGKNLISFMKELKIGTTTAEEIGKLLAMDAKNFNNSFNKALAKDFASGTKGQLGPLSKELSKIEILRNIAAEAKAKGTALTKAEVDVIAQRVKSANDLKAAKYVPKVPKKKTPVDADDLAKAEKEFGKVTDPTKRKWNWRKFKNWAIGAGVTTAALYALYRATTGEEPPIVTDDDTITPTVTPTTTQTTETSKYTSCPETFPIAQFCKNETIRKVQACLGMPSKYQTGNFGSITQGYLERKGLSGTEITQDTINKVCGKNTSTDDTKPDWTDAETEDITSSSTGAPTAGGLTSTSDDMS